MFKRLLIAVSALSMLAAPMAQAQAQSRHDGPRHGYHHSQPRFHAPQRIEPQRAGPPRHHLRKGQRVQNWQRYQRVDHRRYKLRAPSRGQQWVRAGNDYLLIAAATGLVIAMATAR